MHKITKTSMLAAINSKKFLCLNHYVGLWYGQTSWILYEIFAHGKKKTGICITFAFISAGHRHVKDVIGWYCFHYRYYALEVSYFKSSLDRKLLESLWNKYWVNTLSSSSLLTVSPVQGNPTVYLLCPYNLGGGGDQDFFFLPCMWTATWYAFRRWHRPNMAFPRCSSFSESCEWSNPILARDFKADHCLLKIESKLRWC